MTQIIENLKMEDIIEEAKAYIDWMDNFVANNNGEGYAAIFIDLDEGDIFGRKYSNNNDYSKFDGDIVDITSAFLCEMENPIPVDEIDETEIKESIADLITQHKK